MPENGLVRESVEMYGNSKESLIPILQNIIKKEKFLSEDRMIEVAKELDMSSAKVYGVASFYSFLETKPLGENVIRICKNISCSMQGKDEIIKAIRIKLKINIGETTPDKKFSLLVTNCIGQCHKGPAMLVNDDVYTEVTPDKAVKTIEAYM